MQAWARCCKKFFHHFSSKRHWWQLECEYGKNGCIPIKVEDIGDGALEQGNTDIPPISVTIKETEDEEFNGQLYESFPRYTHLILQ